MSTLISTTCGIIKNQSSSEGGIKYIRKSLGHFSPRDACANYDQGFDLISNMYVSNKKCLIRFIPRLDC